MVKRGKVKRKILLDSNDFRILEEVRKKPRGIMDINKAINLEHKNFKFHLDKLIKGGLVYKNPVPKSRKRIITPRSKEEINSLSKILKRLK